MTDNAARDQFVASMPPDGTSVAVELPDGTLISGHWNKGEFHVDPIGTIVSGLISTKTRTLAPWRIHKRTDGWTRWTICKQHALDECEPWCYFESSTEAFKAFAAFEPGVF